MKLTNKLVPRPLGLMELISQAQARFDKALHDDPEMVIQIIIDEWHRKDADGTDKETQ